MAYCIKCKTYLSESDHQCAKDLIEAIQQSNGSEGSFTPVDRPIFTQAELDLAVAEAVVNEARDWLAVVRAAAESQHNRKRCVREGEKRIADLCARRDALLNPAKEVGDDKC